MSEEATKLAESFGGALVQHFTHPDRGEETKAIVTRRRDALLAYIERIERERDEARARVQHIEHERLSTLLRMAAEFDAAPDDAEFESPHPIFLLAEERDALKAENARLCENSDRYLFLRTRITSDDGYLVLVNVSTRFDAPSYAEIDAAIDAARKP